MALGKLRLRAGETVQIIYKQSETILFSPTVMVMVTLYLSWYFAIRYDLVVQRWGSLVLWTLVIGIYAGYRYYHWSSTQYIVTSERLIQTAQDKLFHQSTVEVSLGSITNISYHTTGLLSTLFDYGDVEVQAQGIDKPIILYRVRDPQATKDYLWELSQAIPKKLE